jgi:hypothetical protein
MRFVSLIFLAITLPASAAKYIELEGGVTTIVDKTPEKLFHQKYAAGRAHYVIEVDKDKNGWWLSNGKIINQKSSKTQRYYEAAYVCGNALNKGYLNNEYRTVMDEFYSFGRVNIHVGKRLNIEFKKINLDEIKVGTQATGIELHAVSGKSNSSVYSDLVVTKISDENPCE